MAAGGSVAFTGDDDPELIGDSLPFALKLYEILLIQVPENTGLLLATGKGFAMYAYAFVQLEAEKIPDEEIDRKNEMLQRAKKLYLRGRNYIISALDILHPGFSNIATTGKGVPALSEMEKEDVPYLFWAGMAWMGAFSSDPFDAELSYNKTKAISMITRALELDESFEDGSIHNFFISYYGTMPAGMGGDEKKARQHFKSAVEISKGLSASPYINLATSVCVQKQKVKEFKELLNKVLEIDVEKDPKNKLLNVISQRRARWFLDHIGDYFLIDE